METVLIIAGLAAIWKCLKDKGDREERARNPEAYDRGERECMRTLAHMGPGTSQYENAYDASWIQEHFAELPSDDEILRG